MRQQFGLGIIFFMALGCQTPIDRSQASSDVPSRMLDLEALKALLPRHLALQDYCSDYDRFVGANLTPPARLYLETQRAVCNLPTTDVSVAQAQQKLSSKDIAFDAQGDVFTLYQRGPLDNPDITRMMGKRPGPEMCCTLQDGIWRQFDGTDLWVARYRLADLQAGMIYQSTSRTEESNVKNAIEWRGPFAPTILPKNEELAGKVEDFTLASPQLKEVRRFSIYAPPNVATLSNLPVIVMADGGGYANLADGLIKAGKIRPVIIVGMDSGNESIVGPPRPFPSYITRVQDYTPDEPNSTFTPHLNFIVDTIRPWLQARYPVSAAREDWVATGRSQGGAFAVNTGLYRPDIFGHAWPMSVAGGTVDISPLRRTSQRAKFRISAGHYEPAFMSNSRQAVEDLKSNGVDAQGRWFAAGHANDQWEIALADNLVSTFPKRQQ
jgi:enterochelin esterase-like enzyme